MHNLLLRRPQFPCNFLSSILIYIQQDATLHSLLYLETALRVSGGISTHHQERKQLYLQHLVFVTPLLLLAAIVEELELVWVCCGWRTPPTPTRIIIIFTERSHKFKFRGNQQRTCQNCSAMLTFPPHVSMLSSCTHTGSQILGGVLVTVTQNQQRQPTGQLGNSFCSFAFTGRNISFLCRSHK